MKVDAILTADWHLRDSQPLCRTDNFMNTQIKKVQYIRDLQQRYRCPVLHAGDLFHFWKPSPFLLSLALLNMPDNFHTVYGNHDLPAHRLEERNRSGIYALLAAGRVSGYISGSWGWDIEEDELKYFDLKGRKLFLWHRFVWKGNKPYPEARESDRVENIMNMPQLKDADCVITGDHHNSFDYKHSDGRILVNAGNITRQVANATKPYIWFYNAEENSATPHEIPHEEEGVTRKHLDIKKEKMGKLDAFIDGLSDDFDLGATFEQNLRIFIDNNKDNMKKEVVDLIWEAVDEEK